MSLEERIDTLRAKHRKLDEALTKETQRPHPDDLEIHYLKKEKLKLKDEIQQLAH